jgi:DNA helicase II / ATP-dependent DNA helicase PcrA
VIPPHLEGLNEPQLEAVTSLEGPLLILAGAGSGKTRVLTRRVAHLIYENHRPDQILAVTFTNKAAAEMRRRVEALVGSQARRVVVSTFHSASARFLRREAPLLGFSSSFAIYDDDDQERLLKRILQDLNLDAKRYPPSWYGSLIDRAKNQMQDPSEVVVTRPGAELSKVWRRYDEALRRADAMDFNDLVNHMVRLLEENDSVRDAYHDRFHYVLVDEYQDTNHAQYRLIRALTGPEENLAVVGDDDQSIYSFRGADIRNILEFEKDFPNTKVIKLEQNYRSSRNILAVASTLVAHNTQRKQKTLWADAVKGVPVRRLVAETDNHEALLCAQEIGRLLQEGRRPGDIAVIFRTNAASRPMERAFLDRRIPYVVVGGRKFYQRREIRDIVAYLRLMLNPADDQAFLRILNVPRRGIGESTVARIQSLALEENTSLLSAARTFAEQRGRGTREVAAFVALYDRLVEMALTLPLGRLVSQVGDETGYRQDLRDSEAEDVQDRLENVTQLEADALRFDEEAAGEAAADFFEAATPVYGLELLRLFLDRASLAGQDDQIPDDDGAVTLLTAHLAKGLEYPVVFVSGLVEGVFPHARALEIDSDVEEERRLAYVAFTRARERLILGCYRQRGVHQDQGFWYVPAKPSRFLLEVTREIMEQTGAANKGFEGTPATGFAVGGPRLSRLAKPEPGLPRSAGLTMVPDEPEAFRRGVRVRHPAFGRGVVLERAGPDDNPRLTVLFDRMGRQTVRPRETRLEICLDED